VVAQRLTNPVATDLRLRVDGVRVERVQPAGDLDLFAGQELTVFGRYRGTARAATVAVEGRSADGRVRWITTADFSRRSTDNAFIARLWAVQRVGWLSAERRRNGATSELDDELRALGTTYGIPTELTSYLVVEPSMQANQPVTDVRRRAAPVGMAGRAVPMAAPAPVQLFEAAKAAADQRAVRTTAQLDEASGAQHSATRYVLGRMFTLRDSVWADAAPTGPASASSPRTVRVKPFSEAYFAILTRLPALQDVFALGERVQVHGRNVVLVLDPAGDATVSASVLELIVRDW
jgi:hypothetical protein